MRSEQGHGHEGDIGRGANRAGLAAVAVSNLGNARKAGWGLLSRDAGNSLSSGPTAVPVMIDP